MMRSRVLSSAPPIAISSPGCVTWGTGRISMAFVPLAKRVPALSIFIDTHRTNTESVAGLPVNCPIQVTISLFFGKTRPGTLYALFIQRHRILCSWSAMRTIFSRREDDMSSLGDRKREFSSGAVLRQLLEIAVESREEVSRWRDAPADPAVYDGIFARMASELGDTQKRLTGERALAGARWE